MIKLIRGEQPQVLREKGATWTQRFTDHQGPLSDMADSLRYCYRHAEIKQALKRDSFGKCAYCESHVTQVYPGDTDHILPVSKRADLVVQWENLAFVCSECNREKSDYYDPQLPLLDPFTDEPTEHLAFYGPTVHHRTGAPRGEITVHQLKLSRRKDLWERRKERLEQLQNLLDRIAEQTNESLRAALEVVLQEELGDDKPYAAFAREYVRQARINAVA